MSARFRYSRVQRHRQESREQRTRANRPLFAQDPRRHGRALFEQDLDAAKDGDEQSEAQKASPDFAVGPGMHRATPLQRQQQRYDRRDEEEGAQDIDLLDLLLDRHISVSARRIREEKEHSRQRNGTKREVDPETPSPRYPIRQRTAEDWAYHGRNPEHRRERGDVDRSLPQRHAVADDGHASAEQRRRPCARHGAAADEHRRAGGGGADDGAELEDHEGAEVDPFDVEVGVNFAEGRLERGRREQVG